MKFRSFFMAGIFLLFGAVSLYAQNPAETIMAKTLNKSSWKDMSGQVQLILTNAQNQQRKRLIDMFSRKRTAAESDMLMRFKAPADVKGTGFLIIENQNGDDERYLYLPALRRVKRIASSGKGGNFMSSDFSYYDIGKPKLKDWTYKKLADQTINGYACYQIECLPANPAIKKDTGYGKIIRWIRKDILVTIRAEYFDSGLRLWKVLEVPGIKEISGVWFQTDMLMKDVQNNHQSEMKFTDIKVNRNIPARFFSQRFLQRGH